MWWYFKTIVRKFFGGDDIEVDKYDEIMKIFNEYLTQKKLNLKKGFI